MIENKSIAEILRDKLIEYKLELKKRVEVSRLEISSLLRAALSQRDISENSEYDSARELQAENEFRIKELKLFIKQSANELQIKNKTYPYYKLCRTDDSLLSSCREFFITDDILLDPFKGWISKSSPLGSSLLHIRSVGDKVVIRGITYTIVELKKQNLVQ